MKQKKGKKKRLRKSFPLRKEHEKKSLSLSLSLHSLLIALYIPLTKARLALHPTKPSINARAQQETPVYPK